MSESSRTTAELAAAFARARDTILDAGLSQEIAAGIRDGLSASGLCEDAMWKRFLDTYKPPRNGATPLIERRSLEVIGADEFVAAKFPPREFILEPILHEKTLAMLHSWRGIGKTIFACGIALAVSTAGTFLRWHAPKARRALYIDGELPRETLQERLRDVAAASRLTVSPGLRGLTPDMQADDVRIPSLADPKGQDAFSALIEQEDPDFIVLDNLSTLVRSGEENEAAPWQTIQDWLILQRSRGRSVLMLHHSNKNGAQRGTSKREDVIDLTIKLEHPSDYQESEGCRAEISFEKTRRIRGDAATAFEAHLTGGTWTIKGLVEIQKRRIGQMLADGMTPAAIADEIGVSKSWVYRVKKQLAGGGLNREK